MHVASTINRIIRSESANTPAGNIIILPKSAARVEYATQLNHWKALDLTLTFSEVIAPKNLDIKVVVVSAYDGSYLQRSVDAVAVGYIL